MFSLKPREGARVGRVDIDIDEVIVIELQVECGEVDGAGPGRL